MKENSNDSLKKKVSSIDCMACGTCSSGCPIAGISEFDPRRIIRKINIGREQEVIESNLPWLCSMCGKCEYACPMGISLARLFRELRGKVERSKVPKSIQSGIEMCLKTGNNLGLPDDDFVEIIEETLEELAEDEPDWKHVKAPVDQEKAGLYVTVHNKLVNAQPEDMVHWWKIFDQAGESWTMSSENWEGVNWGMFSGDDEVVKQLVERLVNNMERLQLSKLMYPE